MNFSFQILNPVIDWFYPPVCMGCSTGWYRDRFLCDTCKQDGLEALPERNENSISGAILPQGVVFQDAMWVFHKNQLVQELLHAVKYGGFASLAEELGTMLGHRLLRTSSLPQKTVLIPVPLHPDRLKKRGYNQAEEIAKGIQKTTGLPLLPNGMLRRTRNTKTQTGFSMEKRQENIARAFEIAPPAEPFELAIIVDDVFTTGATVFELHRCLYPQLARTTGIATLAIA